MLGLVAAGCGQYKAATQTPVQQPVTSFWTVENPLPLSFNGIGTSGLAAGWSSGPSDAWIVGDEGSLSHFDGTSWQRVRTPATGQLNGIWGSTPRDIWASGLAGTLLHYDGAGWSAIPVDFKEPLGSIWGSAANDVWIAAGSSGLFHWDGTQIRLVDAGVVYGQSILSGSAPDNVWAITGGGYSLRWNGIEWLHLSLGSLGTFPTGLWVAAPDDVWAVSGNDAYVLHWNGTDLQQIPNPSGAKIFTAWGSGPKDVWMVGRQGIFCFDMMLMLLSLRRGRSPGFLVHDSHLFDGVDERQVGKALAIGGNLAQAMAVVT